ncbi:hypothetical protein MF6396_12045 [Pseudomonas sp. MF6396]|uniref:hypothetical protein n=1 Tax=Pseudomonas sp. MF6396 TaxID=1960828 RepID=UPI000995F59A|nr:hypothetical protein [Pseudomonas sp. MF6396]OOW03123.1 hypothetical protein MF6396_12045 [Pseudomonas sp. MF6396]
MHVNDYTSAITTRTTGASPLPTSLGINHGNSSSARALNAYAGQDTSSVSNLARQLAASATRASERDTGLSHSALGALARSLLDKITGAAYSANKAAHDKEVPATDDPELLARAEQATAFVNATLTVGSKTVENPFAGLSREQLALITYDDSGTFTVNERRAAFEESSRQEQAWRREVSDKAQQEYNTTGRMTDFFKQVQAHYNSLPAIEKAQYPADYAAQVQQHIDADINYKAQNAKDMIVPMTLAETLLTMGPVGSGKTLALPGAG